MKRSIALGARTCLARLMNVRLPSTAILGVTSRFHQKPVPAGLGRVVGVTPTVTCTGQGRSGCPRMPASVYAEGLSVGAFRDWEPLMEIRSAVSRCLGARRQGSRTLQVCCLVALLIIGWIPAKADGAPLSQNTRERVINSALREIREGYISPEKTNEIETKIRGELRNGRYDNISAEDFAGRLTEDLRSAAHDLHFEIEFNPTPAPAGPPPEPSRVERLAKGGQQNYGFQKAEVLEENVGYLKINGFYPAESAGETVESAMNFVAHTRALILDLRDNGGGRPDTVALLASYFFEGAPKPLTGIYWKTSDKVIESYTLPSVPGKKYLDKPLFILTSKSTISAGEAFCYDMKTLKRATLVGETTAGAANPGGMKQLDDHFSMFLPTGKAVNPITHSNWESTGVPPDIATTAAIALDTAYKKALAELPENK